MSELRGRCCSCWKVNIDIWFAAGGNTLAVAGRGGGLCGIEVTSCAGCCWGEGGRAGEEERGAGSVISGEESDSMLCSRAACCVCVVLSAPPPPTPPPPPPPLPPPLPPPPVFRRRDNVHCLIASRFWRSGRPSRR